MENNRINVKTYYFYILILFMLNHVKRLYVDENIMEKDET